MSFNFRSFYVYDSSLFGVSWMDSALANRANQHGRFQVVLFKVSAILLALSTICVIVILCSLLARDTSALRSIAVCVVILVASIPIAMQVINAWD